MSTPVPFFKKAVKRQSKAKVALTGPSGSGKTLSALLLAKGLTNGGRVAVIDTENASSSLYEDKFPGWDYFTVAMNPPYTVQKYLKGIEAALAENFDCLIIDSLSHMWDAEGGLKQQKDALDSRGGNSFANWAPITKLYEQLKSKLLHSDIHLIATMRSKQDYVLEKSGDGKSAPRKVGLAPIMRDGMEYEFTVVFDIGMDHQFMASKDRTDLFDGVVTTITEGTGREIQSWLAGAISTPPKEEEKSEVITKPAAPPPAPPSHHPVGGGGSGAPASNGAIMGSGKLKPGSVQADAPIGEVEDSIMDHIRNETPKEFADNFTETRTVYDEPTHPGDQVSKAPMKSQKSESIDQDWKTWKIPFGKHTGKTMKEIGPLNARKYLDWMEQDAKRRGAKGLTAQGDEYKFHFLNFQAAMAVRP